MLKNLLSAQFAKIHFSKVLIRAAKISLFLSKSRNNEITFGDLVPGVSLLRLTKRARHDCVHLNTYPRHPAQRGKLYPSPTNTSRRITAREVEVKKEEFESLLFFIRLLSRNGGFSWLSRCLRVRESHKSRYRPPVGARFFFSAFFCSR